MISVLEGKKNLLLQLDRDANSGQRLGMHDRVLSLLFLQCWRHCRWDQETDTQEWWEVLDVK